MKREFHPTAGALATPRALTAPRALALLVVAVALAAPGGVVTAATPAPAMSTPPSSAPPSPGSSTPTKHVPYPTTPEGQHIERLLDVWRFPEAEAALGALAQKRAGTPEVLYLEGYDRYLAGDYSAAVLKLKAARDLAPDDLDLRSLYDLAQAAAKAIDGHKESRSARFVLRYPPEDEVLAEWALETLEAQLEALTADLGFVPSRPITVDIYRSPSDLAAVSTLTVEEVQKTGTIALCKWARLMATTPRALSLGYPWLDSIAHELVHYVVSALSDDRAPVWFQEGMAKFLERRWREPAGPDLPPSMQHLLAKGLATGKLITFERMHPSMAKLPSAEDASLAFAEVATAVASMHARGGTQALRTAVAHIREGEDARKAVALALGTSWPEFEKSWKAFMVAQKYKMFPGLEPMARKFRKSTAIASRRGPSEDEEAPGLEAASRYLRLGNMLLRRSHGKAAAMEYEKGAKASERSSGHRWVFSVKLGRTYLALGEPDRALKSVNEARSLYPELPWPHLIAGQAHLHKGEAKEAIASLERSLAMNPFDPSVHCSLAEAYQKLPSPTPVQSTRRTRTEKYCKAMRAAE